MKIIAYLISLLSLILAITNLHGQVVQINEVCSKNKSLIADQDGDYSDWIELHNTSGQEVDLEGFHLSDDPDEPHKWTFSSVLLPENGFLLVFASGKNLQTNELHTNFNLDADGEGLYLTNSEGIVQDALLIPQTLEDEVWGRLPDGSGEWRWLFNASPQASNNFNDEPVTDLQSGIYQEEQLLQISTISGDTVFYTIDGSDPSPNSYLFNESLTLDEVQAENVFSEIPTTPPNFEMSYPDWESPGISVPKGHIIKFATFRNGEQTSEVKSRFVFIGEDENPFQDLPVISISTRESSLFDYYTGILVPGQHFNSNNPEWTGNYFQRGDNWERVVDLKYFSADGTIQLEQQAGLRVHGGKTRQAAQKSLRLYAREEYNERYFEYPLLPQRPLDSYKRFVLRSTMGSWHTQATIKDVVAHQIVKNLDLEYQEYNPVVVFLNGEYWGIHTLRDRPDERYIEYLTGMPEDSVEILRGHQLDLIDYVGNHDLKEDEHYSHVSELLDISNFTDYYIAQMFLANYDWPHTNWRLWRPKDGGKWRSIFYDLDGGIYDCGLNMVAQLKNDDPEVLPNPRSTALFRGLISNEEFRAQFLDRFAELLSTDFEYDRIEGIIDEVFQKYEGEMSRHIQRWKYPSNVNSWQEDCLTEMKSFFECRPCAMVENLTTHLHIYSFPFSCADDSLKQKEHSPFVVFPNPSSGVFQIASAGVEIESASLFLLTPEGKLLKRVDHFSLDGNEVYLLNLKDLSQGVYILRLESQGVTDVRRLMIR